MKILEMLQQAVLNSFTFNLVELTNSIYLNAGIGIAWAEQSNDVVEP